MLEGFYTWLDKNFPNWSEKYKFVTDEDDEVNKLGFIYSWWLESTEEIEMANDKLIIIDRLQVNTRLTNDKDLQKLLGVFRDKFNEIAEHINNKETTVMSHEISSDDFKESIILIKKLLQYGDMDNPGLETRVKKFLTKFNIFI